MKSILILTLAFVGYTDLNNSIKNCTQNCDKDRDIRTSISEDVFIIPTKTLEQSPNLPLRSAIADSSFGWASNMSVFAIKMGKGNSNAYRMVSFDVQSNAHDTMQVRCYRCALGQATRETNQEFCMKNYGFWDTSKGQAKAACK